MKRFLQNITATEFIVFWCCVLVQAMIWSKALLSISMGAIFIVSFIKPKRIIGDTKMPIYAWIVEYLKIGRWQIKSPPQYFKNFYSKKDFLSISIFFFLMLVGGFGTKDLGYWTHSLKIYLPFLLLPMAFANTHPLSMRQFYNVLYFFFLCMVLACSVIVVNFLIHQTEIIDLMGRGKPMPLMREHINFGRMTAFAVLVGWVLYQKKYIYRYAFERKAILILTVFLFVAVHILSIRSALLGLYLCVVYQGFIYIFRQKQYILGISILGLLIIIPFVAYNFIPSFELKIRYMLWDYGKFKEGTGTDYSDSERLKSIQLGWQIFKENWQTGVGSGDIWYLMQEKYEALGQLDDTKLPHNQLLIVGIKAGIMGLILFLVSFLYPLVYRKNYKNDLLIAFYCIVFSYFWFEIPFESAFGVAFYTFFVSLFLNVFRQKDNLIKN